MAINGISSLNTTPLTSQITPAKTSSASPVEQIGNAFTDMLNTLSTSETQSNTLMTQLASGENVDLHDVMIGMEQTDIQFKVAMAIRDRLVDAYREVMRMQV
jgi:flagellar hook-basal body complex protein FliE